MAISGTLNRPKSKKKIECISRVKNLVETYSSIILFNCDNIRSNQLKKIRILLREHGVLFMGKNSLFKKGFLAKGQNAVNFEKVISHLYGNIGMFFTNKNLKEMRDLLESISEMAPVKSGMIAQCDVIVPKGVTSLPPDRTSFFQALRISTMINKSSIEIMSDVNLLKKGQKVGASEATLMQMLNIRPFSYKLNTVYVYDSGLSYPPSMLDLQTSDILDTFNSALNDIACLSLSISYPTRASIPHIIQNGLKDMLALCLEADISNSFVDEFKESAQSAAAIAATITSSAAPQAAESKVEETKAAPAEESDDDMGLGIFD